MPADGNIRSALEIVPWFVPLTEEVVICKDGALLACFEFQGADLEGAEETLRMEIMSAVDRMGGLLRERPLTVWWTVHRRYSDTYPSYPPVGGSEVSRFLDERRREDFLSTASFRNRHYVSLLWSPQTSAGGVFDRISALIAAGKAPGKAIIEGFRSSFGARASYAFRKEEIEQELRDFEGIIPRIEALLSPVQVRRLHGDDLLGFLARAANPGLPIDRKTWDGHLLDGCLMEQPISVFQDVLRFGDGDEALYGAAVSLRTPPDATPWAAVEGLLSYPCEMVLSQIFRVMPTREVERHANALRRTLELSALSPKAILSAAMNKGEADQRHVDSSKVSKAAAAEEAKQAAYGGAVFGWYNLTVMPLSRDLDHLEEITRYLLRSMHASALSGAIRESIHLLTSFASTLPGAWRDCNRWIVFDHQNATDMAPLTGVAEGELVNEHLTKQLGQRCEALITFTTEYNTPFFFNFHAGALGHCAVIGPSRSGKSIGMNFAISQWSKYPGGRVLIFDKDYSCRIPSMLQGGSHIDLRPDAGIRMNPLSLLSDPSHFPFVQQWIEGLISLRDYRFTPQDDVDLRAALQEIAAREDKRLITLGHLAELLPSHLRNALSPWVRSGSHAGSDGQYADYFDNEGDDLDLDRPITCIEMNDIMRVPPAARAFLDYAFYRLQLLLRSGIHNGVFPTLIYVEEAWFLMQDERFANRLMDWLKTFAKLNAILVLTTQSLEDLASLPPQVFAAVRDNIPTKLFLPNPAALSDTAYPVYREKFGLTETQIRGIANATPREDYFIVKPGVSRIGKLRLNPRQVALLRSDTAAQRIFDRMLKEKGEPPEKWWQEYMNAIEEAGV